MALLKEAKRCLDSQVAKAALNAFISRSASEDVLKAVQSSELRRASNQPRSPIDGKLIAIKDNICTTTLPTTCASNILRQYVSPYKATVVQQLEDAGAVVAGKTNFDEFGMGSHSLNSAFGPVNSHLQAGESGLSPGGSSGGSAVAVASGQCYAALATDTGGSVRLPASFCGIVGFKPSYGRLSRHGVVAYANSMDTVGILSSTVSDAKTVFQILDKHDARDPTSLSNASRARIHRPSKKTIRVGVPTEYNTEEISEPVRASWKKAIRHCQRLGDVELVSLPTTKLALSVYYLLASAEASSNLAKYDGVRYGTRSEGPDDSAGVLYAKTRGDGFGEEVKRRILLGAYTLSSSAIDNYFLQAQRVRRKMIADFDSIFRQPNVLSLSREIGNDESGIDFLLCPTAPTLPLAIDAVGKQSVLEVYTTDVLTVPASLAGLPAVCIPIDNSADESSVGMQIIGQYGQDEAVLDFAEVLENEK